MFIVVSIILLSCVRKKEKPVEKEDDFLKVPKYDTTAYTPAKVTYTPASTYTTIFNTLPSTMTPTYWFVQFYEERQEGKEISNQDWRWAVKINTPYFDFIEARKDLSPEVTGKVFFNNIVQLNKESYDSFFKYRELYIDNK